MSGRGIFDVVGGISCIALGILNPEFIPIGFVSAAITGRRVASRDGSVRRFMFVLVSSSFSSVLIGTNMKLACAEVKR
jgi:hypothetical protein